MSATALNASLVSSSGDDEETISNTLLSDSFGDGEETVSNTFLSDLSVVDEKMKRAFLALHLDEFQTLIDLEISKWSAPEYNKIVRSRLSSYFPSSAQPDLREFSRTHLQKEAEKYVQRSLERGNFYAAYYLARLYVSLEKKRPFGSVTLDRTTLSSLLPKTKEKVGELFLKSIRSEEEGGIRDDWKKDIHLLMDLSLIKVRSIEFIRKLGEVDEETAIHYYGKLANTLKHDETEKALTTLFRFHENPESWIYLAKALFLRDRFNEGFEWIERSLEASKQTDYLALRILEKMTNQKELSFKVRLEAARLPLKYTENLDVEEKFLAYMNYYKLLTEASRDEEMARDLLSVGYILTEMAESSLKSKPDLLFELACVFDDEGTQAKDAIIDMFIRAADHGSQKSLKKLTTFEPFLAPERLQEATLFFCRHRSTDGLQALYEKTNNAVFLIIVSRLQQVFWDDDLKISQKNLKYLKRLVSENKYLPVLDIEIYEIQHKLKPLKDLLQHAEKNAYNDIYFDYYYKIMKDIISFPEHLGVDLGCYLFSNHGYPKIRATFKDCLSTYLKELREYTTDMEKELKELQGRHETLVNALSAEDLYDLAQEYDLLSRIEEMFNREDSPSFFEKFLFFMKKAAGQGFLPAVECLLDIYTNGYVKFKYDCFRSKRDETRILQYSKKAKFYGKIRDILVNKKLNPSEQAAQLKEVVKGRTF